MSFTNPTGTGEPPAYEAPSALGTASTSAPLASIDLFAPSSSAIGPIASHLRLERIARAVDNLTADLRKHLGDDSSYIRLSLVNLLSTVSFFDARIATIVRTATPDVAIAHTASSLEQYSVVDMFRDPADISKGIKDVGEMAILTTILCPAIGSAFISVIDHSQRRVIEDMITSEGARGGARAPIDLDSYLKIYFAYIHDPNVDSREAHEIQDRFSKVHFGDKSVSLKVHLDWWWRLYAQTLRHGVVVDNDRAVYLLTTAVRARNDPLLLAHVDRICFPNGVRSTSEINIVKLWTELRAFTEPQDKSRLRPPRGDGAPTSAAVNAAGAVAHVSSAPGKSAGRSDDPTGISAKHRICPTCFWRYRDDLEHTCPDVQEHKCIICQLHGHHSGKCPSVDEGVRKQMFRLRVAALKKPRSAPSGGARVNNTPLLCPPADDPSCFLDLNKEVCFVETLLPSRMDAMDLGDLKHLALWDSGTNVDLLCDLSYFSWSSPLDRPIHVASSTAGTMRATHFGQAEFYIENACNGSRYLYTSTLALYSAEAPYNFIDTPMLKPGGAGGAMALADGTRIWTEHQGRITSMDVHCTHGGLPPQAHGMVYFYITATSHRRRRGAPIAARRGAAPVARPSPPTNLAKPAHDAGPAAGAATSPATTSAAVNSRAVGDSVVVPGVDLRDPHTLAARRAGSPGAPVIKLLLRDDRRYKYVPASGAKPADPVIALGTARKQPSPPSRFNAQRTITADATMHVDISGPHPRVPDILGVYDAVQYGLHVVLKPSSLMLCRALPDRSGESVARELDDILTVEGKGVQIYYSDNASELTGQAVVAVLDKHGVRLMRSTVPGESEGNAVAEASIRVLRQQAAKLSAASRVSQLFAWPVLFAVAACKLNHLPRASTGTSPYEAKFNRPWNFGSDRVFGALAYVHDASRPSKLHARAHAGIYVGNAEELYGKRGHIVIFPTTGHVAITHHLVVDETKYPELSSRTWLSTPSPPEDVDADHDEPRPPPGPANVLDLDDLHTSPPADIGRGADLGRGAAPEEEVPARAGGAATDADASHEDLGARSEARSGPVAASHDSAPPPTVDDLIADSADSVGKVADTAREHPARQAAAPDRLTYGEGFAQSSSRAANALAATGRKKKAKPGIPTSVRQALGAPDAARWKEAIRRELNSLKDLGVFMEHPAAAPPKDAIHMDFTWAFKIKMDGTYRARIALRGFKAGPLPLSEISSPTAASETFRVLLAICASVLPDKYGLRMRTLAFDVDHAFMRSYFDLSKRTYVCPVPDLYPVDDPETKWIIPIKSLYGAKESSMLFYESVARIFTKQLKFERSRADHCVFHKHDGDDLTLVVFHVDDGRIFAFIHDDAKWHKLVADIKAAFDDGIKVLDGSMHAGVDVTQLPDGIEISLESYITSVLKDIDADGSLAAFDTPYVHPEMEKAIFHDDSPRLPFHESKAFLQLMGIANYCRTQCRPDVEHACALISTKVSCPTKVAMDAIRRVIGYLKKTKALGIRYTAGPLAIVAHSDASLNPLPGGRQYSGIFISMAGGAVAWAARRQTIATDNTADAELLSACLLARKIEGIVEFLESIRVRVPRPIPIGQDNAAVFLAMTTLTSRKSRHLSLRLGVLRDLVQERFFLKPDHIHSKDNLADGMTKAHAVSDFKHYRDLWMNFHQTSRFVPRVHPPHVK